MKYWSYEIYKQISTDNINRVAEMSGFESESEAEYFAQKYIDDLKQDDINNNYFIRTIQDK